jgi:NNP family nitrate/nitrite transporter-like MFS transporter
MSDRSKAISVLSANTLAFTVCFAVWMANGVLVTFLVDNSIFAWNKAQIGWLIGLPVLSGSILRLPVGVLTDRYGGRIVFALLMALAAIPMWLLSYATTYTQFVWCSLGFGLAGASFAVGIAYTSVWFPKEQQGTALGVFGAGNAGSALTSMGAPVLLKHFVAADESVDAWRLMPRVYAVGLGLTAIVFWLVTFDRRVTQTAGRTLVQRLAPLANVRVWRFGLYYFLVFGCFVALAQWLIPYYLNVYAMSLGTAGLMAAIFSLPSGVIRAAGGWLSDRCGARTVMYWVLGIAVACSTLLIVPRMDIRAPGQGIMAPRGGKVSEASERHIVLENNDLALRGKPATNIDLFNDPELLIWPHIESWQEPVVSAGQQVKRKELLARGVTHIYFQANVWVFTALVFSLGIALGIGKAAVYKHIPDYFPTEVGVVGGIVGVLGGLGGFVCPILFGYLVEWTGIWTTCWMFLLVLAVVCLAWMHLVVRRILRDKAPHALHQMEHGPRDDESRAPGAIAPRVAVPGGVQ